jgi:DNA-directed RNA polymerase specialized sigma24 family protein
MNWWDTPSAERCADLAARIRALTDPTYALKVELEQAIVEMDVAGASLRDIAAIAGVSHQTVANILARHAEQEKKGTQ